MTHTEKRILAILCRHWRWWAGGNSWKNFEKLSEAINRPLNQTKKATRSLAEKGLLKHQWMVNQESVPAGSGYFLTTKAERI